MFGGGALGIWSKARGSGFAGERTPDDEMDMARLEIGIKCWSPQLGRQVLKTYYGGIEVGDPKSE